MKQHWLVVPIDIKADRRVNPFLINTPPGTGGEDDGIERVQIQGGFEANWAEAQQLAVQPAQPRGARRQQEAPQVARAPRDERGNPVGTQYGFKMDRETVKEIDSAFTTKELAEQHALKLASEHPGKQYGVFACVHVFETTTPNVIRKVFSDSGELILEGNDGE